MSPSGGTMYLAVVTGLAAVIGAIDAGVGAEWDLFAVFVFIALLVVGMLARIRGRRPAVPLRADLVAWLRERSSVTGEPLTVLADRAVATYRQGTDPSYSHRHDPEETRA